MKPIRARRYKSKRRTAMHETIVARLRDGEARTNELIDAANEPHADVFVMCRQLVRDGLLKLVRYESDIEHHAVWALATATRTSLAAQIARAA